MRTVEYKYDLDEKVSTPFDQVGIVTMLGFDEGGNQYYVKTANTGSWFKESQLSQAVEKWVNS